ncbi:MAG: diguanylate cyclase, partial [Pseudomonadota bacterium]
MEDIIPAIAGLFDARAVDAEKISALVRLSPYAIASNALNALLLSYGLLGHVRGDVLALWLASIGLLCVLMIWRWLNVRDRAITRVSVRAVRHTVVYAIISALPWCAFFVHLIGRIDPSREMLLFAVLAGISAGGGLLLSRVPMAAIAYVLTLLIPCFVICVSVGTLSHNLMAGFTAIYTFFITLIILHHSRLIFDRDDTLRNLNDKMSKLNEARQEIELLASKDTLTGLPNRRVFSELLRDALQTSRKDSRPTWLFVLDLDHFKSINDTMGHAAGDELLRVVAKEISRCVGRHGQVGRLGGDEFAVIYQPPGGIEDPEHDTDRAAERIIAALSRPKSINGVTILTGCSIGVSQYPRDARNDAELLQYADMALFRAKEAGRGIVSFFDDRMRQRAHDTERNERDLRRAIENGEFELFFQPQFNLTTHRLLGFEGLLRWNHPERGLLSP